MWRTPSQVASSHMWQALEMWQVQVDMCCEYKISGFEGVVWRKECKMWKSKSLYFLQVVCVLSHSPFATLWTVAHQIPLPMKFSRQEYWSGLPFPTSGDLPDLRIKPTSLASPALAAAVKSLQSCLTLCNPINGSPPGSPVPGILPARTLEWVAVSFSNAWKWKVKVKSLSHVRLLATPWTAAYKPYYMWKW